MTKMQDMLSTYKMMPKSKIIIGESTDTLPPPPTVSELVEAAEACDRMETFWREGGFDEKADAFAAYAVNLRERLRLFHEAEANKETAR